MNFLILDIPKQIVVKIEKNIQLQIPVTFRLLGIFDSFFSVLIPNHSLPKLLELYFCLRGAKDTFFHPCAYCAWT